MKAKRIYTLVLTIVFILCQTNQVFAISINNFPFFSQYPYRNGCWAASASMVTAFFNGDSIDRTYDIIGGTDRAGSMTDTKNAIYQYTRSHNSGSIYSTNLSWTAVKYQINNNGPICAGLTPLNNGIVHMVVLNGYYESTDLSTKDVYYHDPANSSHQDRQVSYSYLLYNSVNYWSTSLFYK